MDSLSFDLTGKAPTPASRPKVGKFGVYYPKAHTAHKNYLDDVLKGVSGWTYTGAVAVYFLFVMPRYKTSGHPVHRADVDNLAKLPMDCMTQCKTDDDTPKFWFDDDLVVALTTMKRFAAEDEEPHSKVKVRKVEDIDAYVNKVFDDA